MRGITRGIHEVKNRDWYLGFIVGILLATLVFVALLKMQPEQPEPSSINMPKDIVQAYNMGIKDALRTNPPSLDLEQTCVNMWANKQPVKD